MLEKKRKAKKYASALVPNIKTERVAVFEFFRDWHPDGDVSVGEVKTVEW